MAKEVKSDSWNIEADVLMLYKNVQFFEPLTKEEAIDAFYDEDYLDIADEEVLEINSVSLEGTTANESSEEETDEDEEQDPIDDE